MTSFPYVHILCERLRVILTLLLYYNHVNVLLYTNREDPDEMLHSVAFNQALHYLLRYNNP